MTEGRYAPQALSLLRIVAALLFLLHGSSKLFGFPPFGRPLPEIGTLLWIGAVLELVGGLALLVGFLSRPVAFVLSGEMAVAYWMFHAPQSTFPSVNMGEAAILFCFIFLLIAAAGPGPWSLDDTRKRRREQPLQVFYDDAPSNQG
ncbi:MAG TPA: DoxX family protein [Sphingomicrobium sp.]|nr:DoxX family protein [Sphingomicrobium sp.]